MIEGYRTIYDMGGPLNQAEAAATRRQGTDAGPTNQTSAGTAAPMRVQGAETPRPVAESGAAQSSAPALNTPDTPDAEPRRPQPQSDPAFREATLPQLSAEALATALMTAEPDKALVPRVLPADMAEEAT